MSTSCERGERGERALSLTLAVNATPTRADIAAGAAIPAVGAQVGTARGATRGPLLAGAHIAIRALATRTRWIPHITELVRATPNAATATVECIAITRAIKTVRRLRVFTAPKARRTRTPAIGMSAPPFNISTDPPTAIAVLGVAGGVDALSAAKGFIALHIAAQL